VKHFVSGGSLRPAGCLDKLDTITLGRAPVLENGNNKRADSGEPRRVRDKAV